jgi:streptogramin lyase/pimeloyl-ACP methyl ester carboxylesterase
MNDLLQRIDPAAGVVIDSESLRSRVDERLGFVGKVLPVAVRVRRPWLAAAATFAIVLAVFVPVMLNRQGETTESFAFDEAVSQIHGVESVLHESAGGGVRTFAVDGETMWVTSALARQLTRVNVANNVVEESYPIDAYVEGVKIGGGYLWLLSYDNGGEVLRFDPNRGVVDLAIPLGASPGGVQWYADRLWVSNSDGQLLRISVAGVIESTTRGELVGMAFGSLWVIDPETRIMQNYTEDGPGSVAIPTDGMLVGQLIEGGGYLWALERDLSIVGSVHRYEPDGGEPTSVRVGFGAHSMVELDGSIWVASIWDETVTRIDAATAELLTVTPLPGRTGAVAAADGSIWVSLYQPGLLIRLDPEADLMEIGNVVVDEVVDGFRFLCTGGGDGPTILLDPEWWIGPGSWSVIQAELSSDALVCSHGAVDDRDSAAKVDNLLRVLEEFNVEGPYLLVAHGTGVVSTRLLAEQAIDVAGVVLVEPVPTGFSELMQTLLPEGMAPETFGLDDPGPLGDLGNIPLVVIGDDQSATFLSDSFDENTGSDPGTGARLAEVWADGLAFYAGLSTDSRSVTISGSYHMVIWDRPDTVVDGVLDLLGVDPQ